MTPYYFWWINPERYLERPVWILIKRYIKISNLRFFRSLFWLLIEVWVLLHSELVPVPAIISEALLTDLQLTSYCQWHWNIRRLLCEFCCLASQPSIMTWYMLLQYSMCWGIILSTMVTRLWLPPMMHSRHVTSCVSFKTMELKRAFGHFIQLLMVLHLQKVRGLLRCRILP